MKFNSIRIEEYDRMRLFEFSRGNNLIHSTTNSKGKTTLLRLMLYSIGYNIPNTRHIKFENLKVESKITLDNGNEISLFRESREYIVLRDGGFEKTYILNAEESQLHSIIFNASNKELINNLLGLFYFDQEKGWTLLNRGVVIGSIHFSIEELIRGIANIDCSTLIKEKESKKQDLLKYRQMYSVAKYQQTIDLNYNNLAATPYNEKIDADMNNCKIQINILKAELKRIDKVLKDNKYFRNFIANLGLIIKTPKGETVTVTEENIVDLNDTIDFLIAKRKIIAQQYNQLYNRLIELENEHRIEQNQLSFFENEETIAQIFDKRISSIPVNEIAVKNAIINLENEIQKLNCLIKDRSKNTKEARIVIRSIFAKTKSYLTELNINQQSLTDRYLFTSNLKELSGAILHKTVFAFRLACLAEVEKHLGIKFPIMLDSPSGKEIDHINVETMIKILQRDFSNNQIFIASINSYNIDNINTITLINRLIE